ncbi:glycerophosphodiester phosphodiesterase [Trifolium repens]|nr:glycerophosphodiester phosphodiesterase [Trifolium repens]
MRWVIQNIPRSCNLNGCEIVKFLNECNPGELDIEALFDVLAEKAKDDLFLKCSYAPPRSIIPMNMNVKCVRHFSTRSTNNVKNVSEKNKKNVKSLSQIKEEDAVYVTCARPHLGGLVAHTDGGVAFVCEVKMRFMQLVISKIATSQLVYQDVCFGNSCSQGIYMAYRFCLYLQPHTSLVSDAHKVGLEVYASDFANDVVSSYSYSYDPLAEYLQFFDNGDFTVVGVLTDFPITPSAAIAYNKAISDGVDVLDCPVQISKDGTPFCLNSINLLESTTVAQTSFSDLALSIPQIQHGRGIFTFNLTWSDIKGLTPSILNPYSKYALFRNPKFKNAGKLVTLSDFLTLTKNKTSLSGILIVVENAAYLAAKQGLGVIDAVIDALSKAGYDKPGSQKVYIQSTNSSVLLKFKEKTKYELVYKIDETVGDAVKAAVDDIKSFASAVVISKDSIFPRNTGFLTTFTNIVPTLQASNLSIFVETFSNEFVSQAWDYFSDPTVEINSFIQEAGINRVITEFPKTASRFSKNKCLNLGNSTPPYMQPVRAGNLFGVINNQSLPPAEAPLPPLTAAEVVESPLPSVVKLAPASSPTAETKSPPGNAQPKVSVCLFLSSLTVFVASILLL